MEQDYQLGEVGVQASALVAQLAGSATPCTPQTGPADLLQSPVQVGNVVCGPDLAQFQIMSFLDVRGLHYYLETIEIGTGDGRGFLVGENWLMFADPAALDSISSTVGGTIYTDKKEALTANPGYSSADPYVDCYINLTVVVTEYVKSGVNHIGEYDQMMPGLANAFYAAMYGVVPQLASYKSGDDAAATQDLIPYAERMRGVCHKLHPDSI
ncbi:hypothetical protein [Antricoccus suffuscus]|uniref:hypothetical protein n=1 Tax=Antricoccus suffuscus TaxID=1629062 RepID=UPI0011B1E26B|nr:hypothetical protein [Antricoccus suffuscus]